MGRAFDASPMPVPYSSVKTMGPPQQNLWVAANERTAFLKIRGRATFTSSVDFKRFASAALDRGYRDFVFDLTECLIMDSTFLGVMAGFSQRATAPSDAPPAKLTLLNANPRVLDLLANLGVNHLFKTLEATPNAAAEYQPAECVGADKLEIARTCLEAHETLMGLNAANAAKFKDVTRFFAEDIERLKVQPAPKLPGG